MDDIIIAAIVGAFCGVCDALKRFWYVLVALVLAILLLWFVHTMFEKDRQDCRAKGGTPGEHNGAIVCIKDGRLIDG